MIRTLSTAAALATSAALLTAAGTARAQTPAYYVAVPAAEATKANTITRSTPWTLRGGAYLANRAPERPLVLCQLLARDVGALKSFSVGGAALEQQDLDKCNSKAKGGAGAAMAANGAPATKN